MATVFKPIWFDWHRDDPLAVLRVDHGFGIHPLSLLENDNHFRLLSVQRSWIIVHRLPLLQNATTNTTYGKNNWNMT